MVWKTKKKEFSTKTTSYGERKDYLIPNKNLIRTITIRYLFFYEQ